MYYVSESLVILKMISPRAVVFICCCIFKNGAGLLNLPEGSDCPVGGTNGRYGRWSGVGKCVNGEICPSLFYDLTRNKNEVQICSFKGMTPIVCCDSCELRNISDAVVAKTSGIFYWKNGNKAWDKCLDYTQYADKRCSNLKNMMYLNKAVVNSSCTELGTARKRIGWGGRDAGRREYPHMALLGYGEKLEDAQWQCGGSLISERFILTAGHCLFSPGFQLWVSHAALGILRRSDPASAWQTYRVSIISHPDYAPPAKYHDIALLKTDRQVVFSDAVIPACLSQEELEDTEFTATGWGYTGRNTQPADTLQVVTVKPFDVSECRRQYPVRRRHMPRGFDNDTQLCAGDMERPSDTCGGDSGGPLQYYTFNSLCMYMVMGVTSAGHDCGDVGTAGIYTRVRPYLQWITDTVWP